MRSLTIPLCSSYVAQERKAPSGPVTQPQSPQARTLPGLSPMLPALLQVWMCSCYRNATFLTSGLHFLSQRSCFHFVPLPMTLAGLPNKPTRGEYFLLMKVLASPTLIVVFSLSYFDGDKVTLTPLFYCDLKTRITVLELILLGGN